MSHTKTALVIANTVTTSPQTLGATFAEVIANNGILNQVSAGADITLPLPTYAQILAALPANNNLATPIQNFEVNQEFVFKVSNNGPTNVLILANSSDGTVTARGTPTGSGPGATNALASIAAKDTKVFHAVVNFVYSIGATPAASSISIY